MRLPRRWFLFLGMGIGVFSGGPLAIAADEHPGHVLSLDGTWQIGEGRMDQLPASFGHTVPVPGLVSLAKPAFIPQPGPLVADRSKLSEKDPARDAFWYRRTFHLDQPVPAVARLKVHKAMYGTQVILNGKVLGYHAPSFTPGYFEARNALIQGENVLLIRVGADRDAVTAAVPAGFDYEKQRYIPGIFDSVELILSGTPHFLQVQTVPAIAHGTVRVQAVLRNDGEDTRRAISFVVREAGSGEVAGRLTSEEIQFPSGKETVVDVRIPITNCRLWSPEDPFLYTLEVDSQSDTFRTRFGMREFRFDPLTKRAVLNGKPYFMRGSNFTVYRFFEDEECKDRPWDLEWIRLLHKRVKEMHWNCLRYCIGFPPEAWYDMADEAGILIQDEFPLWDGPREVARGELASEFREWMRERWNHPCVAIWDAQNETKTPETGAAIAAVRDLDLSNRPWDNGWSAAAADTDCHESHPYHFNNPNTKLSDVGHLDLVPQDGSSVANDGRHAVVINEYGWLWLNRNGTPTTLTRDLYRNLLGDGSTVEQRRHLYATYLAAETEFWRIHRQAAAVMHFTTLGYSRPDGQTSDHWIDVGKLTWEPEFHRYVRDAFAPVGLMVDFWRGWAESGKGERINVLLINDLEKPWSGPVALRVRRTGATIPLIEEKQECRMDSFGHAEIEFELKWPQGDGAFSLEAELQGADGEAVQSLREVKITDRKTSS